MILGNYFIKLVFEKEEGHWQEAFAKGTHAFRSRKRTL